MKSSTMTDSKLAEQNPALQKPSLHKTRWWRRDRSTFDEPGRPIVSVIPATTVGPGDVTGLVLPEGVTELVCDRGVQRLYREDLSAVVVGNRLLILPIAASLLDEGVCQVSPDVSVWEILQIPPRPEESTAGAEVTRSSGERLVIDLTEDLTVVEIISAPTIELREAQQSPLNVGGFRRLGPQDSGELLINTIGEADDSSPKGVLFARPLRAGQHKFLPVVELTGVVRNVPMNDSDHSTIQETLRADVQIKTGEFVALVGARKRATRMLLSLMVGLDQPDSGSVLHSGVPIAMRSANHDRFQIAQPGILPTTVVFDSNQVAEEFVAFPMRTYEIDMDQAQNHAVKVLCQIGGVHLVGQQMGSMTQSDRRLVAVARALAGPWAARFLFDPLHGFDAGISARVRAAVLERVSVGETVIALTDDPELLRVANRVIGVSNGALYEVVRRVR
jgi:putative ABC transport system ATP-binding protein